MDNACHLKEVIMTYCRSYGQKINKVKSSLIFNQRADETTCKAIEDTLRISRTREPGKYLGLLAVWGKSKRDYLGFLKTRIKEKLN